MNESALSNVIGVDWRRGAYVAERRQRPRPNVTPLFNRKCLTYHVAMVAEDRDNATSYAEPSAEDAARLMRAVASKDRRAFETLYYTYSPRLGRYLQRLLKNREAVDEALNDVMLVVWQSAERYDPSLSRLSTWLFGIAHNKALKALSKFARQQVEISTDSIESDDFADLSNGADVVARSDQHNPEQTLMGRQLGHALQWAIESLSVDHRSVLELAFAQDYSYQEIATVLDCPVNTVKTRMFYARKHLAELIAFYESNTPTIVRRNLS